MTESLFTERALIEQLLDSLRALPDVHAELDLSEPAMQAAGRLDAKIDLHVAGKSIVLLVEAKKSVYPRDVRQAFLAVEVDAAQSPSWGTSICSWPSRSRRERRTAQSRAYRLFRQRRKLVPADLRCLCPYIDKPVPKTLEKSVRSLFSGRRAQVLYALLVNCEEWFGVTEVAERAQVAPSTASDVLGELERFDWLVSRGQGPSKERHLREPGALLDAWAKQITMRRASAQAVFCAWVEI